MVGSKLDLKGGRYKALVLIHKFVCYTRLQNKTIKIWLTTSFQQSKKTHMYGSFNASTKGEKGSGFISQIIAIIQNRLAHHKEYFKQNKNLTLDIYKEIDLARSIAQYSSSHYIISVHAYMLRYNLEIPFVLEFPYLGMPL